MKAGFDKMDKLIVRLIEHNISEEESEMLEEWLREKPDHQDYFNAFVQISHLINLKAEFDYKPSLTRINENLKENPRKITAPYFKYAVAASAALLMSIGYLFFKGSDQSVALVVNEIGPGTDKAVLTLDDGTDIALEKGIEYANDNARSNGTALVYDQAAKNEKEIRHNFLTIPRGGQFDITLADGTRVWLNSESKLKYPVAFASGKPREVELVYGEAYFDVLADTDNQGTSFIVKSDIQVIEVLGTEFNVKAYRDEENIYTTLVEGKVSVGSKLHKQVLSPDHQSTLQKNSEKMVISQVKVFNEISWKRGVFSFDGKPLKEILTVLARWYDIEVIFENKELEDVRFVGLLSKHQELEGILLTIKNTNFINDYSIDNNTVLIK